MDNKKSITSFRGKPYKSGNSFVVVIPKTRFQEKKLTLIEYEFVVNEVI
jgi:hypothetical protein